MTELKVADWDVTQHVSDDEKKTLQFRAHKEPISSCRFLFHDTLIATASHDGSVGIWEMHSGSNLHSLCGHTHRVVSLATNQSSHTLFSASWDKTVRMWDLNSQEEMWKGTHESHVTTCHTAPEQTLVVTGCDDGSSHYWDTRTGQRAASFKAHPTTITCCRLSPNSNDLCTCSMDKSALIWDGRTRKKLLTLSGHVNVVSGCGFSHNGHYLATCSWDKTVHVYDITSGGYRSNGPIVLSAHIGSVSACVFTADGKLLVSCGYDRDINIWNTCDFRLRNTFKGHDEWIQDIDISETNKQIVSCGKDGIVHIWNTDVKESHYFKKKEKLGGINLVECSACGRTFSPAGETEAPKTLEEKITSSKTTLAVKSTGSVTEETTRLCVFCRLKDPSRTLEQRSDQYLTSTQ